MKNVTANILSTSKDILLETIWPTRCVVCDRPGNLLCTKCALDLPYIDATKACNVCGEPFAKLQCCGCSPAHMKIPENQKDTFTHEFDQCVSVTVLNEQTGRIVTVYKDGGEQRLGQVIAYFINQYIPPLWKSEDAFLTYLPSTKLAFDQRGFDHCLNICKYLKEYSNLPLIDVFNRPKSTDQRLLSRKERVTNMKRAISIKNDLEGVPKTAILIDDVFTTGATLNAAANRLHKIGCKSVFCITFTRTF